MLNRASTPSADHRLRHFVALSLALLIALLGPASAWAGRLVRVYDMQFKGDASEPAVQDAMRRVLVRATGRRDAGQDPAFSTIVAEAPRYVQSTRHAANGDTVVTFDGAALEQAVMGAGRSVWDPERPFTLVVFDPPLSGAALEAARLDVEKAAESRGLPISLAPVPVTDANGAELPRDVVLQSAQRLGGDAVLVARGASAALNGVYQWTLYTPYAVENWNGALDAGVNGAVDALARVQDPAAPLGELEATVQVAGITTLNDYAAVSRLLENIPGSRHVNLFEVNGGSATFDVLLRGGAEALDRALSGSGRLTRVGASGGTQLMYEYHP